MNGAEERYCYGIEGHRRVVTHVVEDVIHTKVVAPGHR